MTRDEAKEEIKRRIKCTEFLVKARKSGYCCPVCGSGTHGGGTGAVKYYPETNTWYCHVCKTEGRNSGGDVISLYMATMGKDFNGALADLAAAAGLVIDEPQRKNGQTVSQADFKDEYLEEAPKQGDDKTPPPTLPRPADFTKYYARCRELLPLAKDYLESRGLSFRTAAEYGLGFDPKADPARSGHPCPRLIIPASSSYYVARRTDGGENFKKMNPKGSTPAIFNLEAIRGREEQKIFVVEGALDALSIIEVGAEAIALNSTANAAALIKTLETVKTSSIFILCLDNDPAGQKASNTLSEGLSRLNIPFIVADICAGSKDPNEALCKDRALFLSAIEDAQTRATTKPDNTALYIDLLMASDIKKFQQEINTGFEELDLLAGGLYPGLYVIAAISSLGKTTFALQMAEQIAGAGQDVVFFSLEQSKFELVSKGIARRTAQKDMSTAVTSLAIRKGYLPPQVLEASEQYKADVGDRFSIVQGDFNCDIAYIAQYLRNYVQNNGVRPVVFVDYLQILQPTKERQNTKETVDIAVTELKRLSRELNIPILAISSINRANYLTPIDFESLKESGCIEYTCDCIWGLQLQCLNNEIFKTLGGSKIIQRREAVKKAKKETPRKIELVCLKNRYGVSSFSCYFDYYPAYDLIDKCEDLDFIQEYEPPKAGRTI